MNKKQWTSIVAVLAIAGFWASKHFIHKIEKSQKMAFMKLDGKNYWTCPMHPQIHLDHAGECPICHMKLVQVAEQVQMQNQKAEAQDGDKRTSVGVTGSQIELLGVQKQEVETMTLTATIPVSGRVISSSSIAFQVYESDLQYVRPGLHFKGSGSANRDEISGIINAVDSLSDPSSRTVRVVGGIHKGPKGLLPETSFSGEIQIELKNVLSIPESAVLHTGTSDLVYLFGEGNRLTPKRVTLGMKAEGFYQVLDGLKAGDFISSGPNFLIDSEAKIRGAND